jgi:hypothetical protein
MTRLAPAHCLYCAGPLPSVPGPESALMAELGICSECWHGPLVPAETKTEAPARI